ncbi:unnamed protein product [Microthlaspi erraticum]|uniref:F-box domain-containing protein n=1 Tax=Microthlaspi erraticum TaxID=1685480 RepID=A0A6D2J6D9_9BRAS|nr:unnamed protein product [Microthlaspi erraticum]
MTMMSDLPRELEEEILSRVPLKSMRSVRSTCKRWDTLSKNHTKEGESYVIVKVNYDVYLMSVVINDVFPTIEPKGKLTCLDEQVKVKIFQVLHCEGLLLCVLRSDSRLVVWNPYLGQTRFITPRYYSDLARGLQERYTYALGYVNKNNKSCRSHKLLRFIDLGSAANRFAWYEMYDFDSDLWMTLDVTPHWRISHLNSFGVSLKGTTYWRVREQNSYHLVCFDFTRERFGPLLHIPPFNASDVDTVNISCVREEKLGVLLEHEGSNEIEIWITTKIEAGKLSWRKFLTVDKRSVVDYTISFYKRSFLIDEEKKLAVVFDDNGFGRKRIIIFGEAGDVREVDLEVGTGCWSQICYYVPSLVQCIKKPPGGKRKRQSDLETRRYDEKMSKLVALEKANQEARRDEDNYYYV